MKKRNERNFSKKIKYACRKTLADSRARVRGRFAKNNEFGELHKHGSSSHHYEEDEDGIQCAPIYFGTLIRTRRYRRTLIRSRLSSSSCPPDQLQPQGVPDPRRTQLHPASRTASRSDSNSSGSHQSCSRSDRSSSRPSQLASRSCLSSRFILGGPVSTNN
ncbi:hypothetical protein F2Q70_00025188 [Brassica cretica]|uniref:CCT domain-containing protein n=1 Tax=Brassica cretica TaxID=69181 RepID=A0A8S9L9Q4_BRACR|nr:hypothetical protein F2Q70_00025188 [Brassica cretica]